MERKYSSISFVGHPEVCKAGEKQALAGCPGARASREPRPGSQRFRFEDSVLACLMLAILFFSNLPVQAGFGGLCVYEEGDSRQNHGAPSGWMGDFRDLRIDLRWTNNPHAGSSCIKLVYTAEGSRHANMIGVMWQHPPNNDGSVDGGLNLTGAKRVVFWARGEQGGEFIHAFTFGGTLGAYPDTDKAVLPDVFLSKEWTRFEIDLTGLDLSYISSFFGWATGRFNNPEGMVFYLDEIRIE